MQAARLVRSWLRERLGDGGAPQPQLVMCERPDANGATQPQLAALGQPDAASTTQPKLSANARSERSPISREQAFI
ncbi:MULTISPECIES: hypothetical protein [Amycolatopsis]|uniref:Uncharacterized protein n=1 Tax=Amycolatopsis dendrobii TaxID=2760662 RepID=A0A7W3W148_9PSEU|nr:MULTISPECIES: hypothetical protein [Amycolatopsis]MBB1156905.1 hypothetical protein [Amycolatopsis dendrobii]UKD53608.1 hypothetical protein L3Q65_37835 [Amycolatopsis sp. FU40]